MNETISTRKKILSHLIDARAHGVSVSGTKLANDLGISRNAVWKAIHALQEEGFDIASEPRKGYYLASPADMLHADAIRDGIRSHGISDEDLQLIVLDSIDSTNNYAKTLPYDGPATAITADEQTGGRGRYGRTFESPKGTGVYITYSFKPMFPISEVTQVTTVAAALVHQALTRVSGESLGIKWVNDIYRGELKIAGILSEALGSLEGHNFERIIVGIGINCLYGGVPDELEGIAGTLTDQIDAAFTRNQVISEVVSALHQAYAGQTSLHAEQYLDYYREHCFILGRPVKVLQTGKEPVAAVAENINDNFELLARTDSELLTLSGGEVSLKIR